MQRLRFQLAYATQITFEPGHAGHLGTEMHGPLPLVSGGQAPWQVRFNRNYPILRWMFVAEKQQDNSALRTNEPTQVLES